MSLNVEPVLLDVQNDVSGLAVDPLSDLMEDVYYLVADPVMNAEQDTSYLVVDSGMNAVQDVRCLTVDPALDGEMNHLVVAPVLLYAEEDMNCMVAVGLDLFGAQQNVSYFENVPAFLEESDNTRSLFVALALLNAVVVDMMSCLLVSVNGEFAALSRIQLHIVVP